MAKYNVQPTNNEATFGQDEIIVSKTDLTGRILYANDVFLRVAGFGESEVLNQPHSMIRHPDMPRAVFKLLWDTIQSGDEIFAYVKNMARNGDFYWVIAHVTPSFDSGGNIVGYHSNRRVPERRALEKVEPLYRQLLAAEQGQSNERDGLEASFGALVALLKENRIDYDEFVWSLAA